MYPIGPREGKDRLVLFGLLGLFAITAFILAIALYLSSGGVEG
jgi:hypothetical protein